MPKWRWTTKCLKGRGLKKKRNKRDIVWHAQWPFGDVTNRSKFSNPHVHNVLHTPVDKHKRIEQRRKITYVPDTMPLCIHIQVVEYWLCTESIRQTKTHWLTAAVYDFLQEESIPIWWSSTHTHSLQTFWTNTNTLCTHSCDFVCINAREIDLQVGSRTNNGTIADIHMLYVPVHTKIGKVHEMHKRYRIKNRTVVVVYILQRGPHEFTICIWLCSIRLSLHHLQVLYLVLTNEM